MARNSLKRSRQTIFEQIKKTDAEGQEYWTSRELAKVLEYTDYRNFTSVVERAKIACKNSSQKVEYHFVDFTDMIEIGKGGKRQIESIRFSRYACYLIVQNADPNKEIVALGQSYFAVQTRIAEIKQSEGYNELSTEDEQRLFLRHEMIRQNMHLADAAKEAGIINAGDYATFQDYGYQGLYGGLKLKDIHRQKGLGKGQKILDYMGSTELAANLFRTTQTEDKLRRDNIKGKTKACQMHYEVGTTVRRTIEELGGVMPESLPAVESIKKIEEKEKLLDKK
ncbi:MAG: DNA damage-inducible protein D [Candidatus Symbiothrix sp.]|nr:DNA damage-inducible protein D [Candidatus Symbiothrix sp.]